MEFVQAQQGHTQSSLSACPAKAVRYGERMISNGADQSGADALPPTRLGVAITGHRAGNSAYDANRLAIEATLGRIVDTITEVLARQQEVTAPARLHSLLANGADLLAVEHAL